MKIYHSYVVKVEQLVPTGCACTYWFRRVIPDLSLKHVWSNEAKQLSSTVTVTVTVTVAVTITVTVTVAVTVTVTITVTVSVTVYYFSKNEESERLFSTANPLPSHGALLESNAFESMENPNTEASAMLGERGLGLVVYIPSGCVAKINIP